MVRIPSTIYAKLERAESKFKTLQDDIEKWKSNNSLSLHAEYRENKHGLDIKCDMKSLRVPLETWRIDYGEIIYALRSALDNLIYYCATRHSDPPRKPRLLYFPIYKSEKDYRQHARKTINQLEGNIGELIERIQPFQRNNSNVEGNPEIDPLVTLNVLSNYDKHRMPIPFLIPPETISINHCFQFHSDEDAKANIPPNVVVHTAPLSDGCTVLEFITNCPVKMSSGVININAKVALQANDFTRDIIEVLAQLIWYARLILEEFERNLSGNYY